MAAPPIPPHRPNPTPNGAQWISAPEAARRYGVSRRTFGRMIARGEVPFRKRGVHKQSRVVVHATALARLLDPANAV